MAATTVAVTELALFVLAIVAILVGTAVNGRVAALRTSGIPPAVTGGLLFAALAWIARAWPGIELAWPGAMRSLLLLVFFSGLGLSAKFAGLKQGGVQVALLCVVIALTIVVQNAVGIALARAFQQPAALGLFLGSIPFLGGHGTAAAWAQAAEASALPAAFELGIAAATIGLVAGGIVSGPVATLLVRRAKSSPATDVLASAAATAPDEGRSLGDVLSSDRWLRALLLIAASLAIGEVFQHLSRGAGLNLPAFLTAMFGGILITNLADVVRRPVDHALAELVSTIALRLFLAMSMLSLKLWELIPFAGLLAAVIVAQVALIVALAAFVLFPMLGRDRDAAIASGGFIGFAMGAMPVGLGTMRRLAETLGPAPRAFLIITLAASLFTDTANAVAIQAFFDWLN
jgi:ESS family glutamate:Na+ symporter